MTRNCDTCGGALDAAYPLRVCPGCLSGVALVADVPPLPRPDALPFPALKAIPRLTFRRDFFDKYDLIGRIGGGGQGDVWKVWDFEFRRHVAMKRLGAKDVASEPVLYRFLAEAQIASQLEHPGILPIFDVGLDPDGRPFYTTQLLPGTTLADVWRGVHQSRCSRREEAPTSKSEIRNPKSEIERSLSKTPGWGRPVPTGSLRGDEPAPPQASWPAGPGADRGVLLTPAAISNPSDQPAAWTLPRALEMLLRVCDVMTHSHSRGVIHRDLKPFNILVGPFGDVRVIDWGSAHVLTDARKAFQETFVPLQPPAVQTDRETAIRDRLDSPLTTESAGGAWTPLFTPPEILLGRANPYGPPTDVYAMGVMLYELLAERPPYSCPDGTLPEAKELKELIKAGPPSPVRSINPSASRDHAAIAEKAMAHDPARRYATMPELAEDLRAAQEIRPVRARPGRFLRVEKFVQRNLSYVFLCTLLLAGSAVAILVARDLHAQREAARRNSAMSAAELATRSGRWREALAYWNEAEASGFPDAIQLGLLRAEGWTVLSERSRAKAELEALNRRSDLGARRGAVLLRLGEQEMHDRATSEQGRQRVREASTNTLSAADQFIARGLLADSTPKSLAFFKEALKLSPYSHSAHAHTLGLESVLGRHDAFSNHLGVVNTLFPGEFSPGFLEALELALHGRLADAQTNLAALRDRMTPERLQLMEQGITLLAHASEYFDIDNYLDDSKPGRISRSQLMTEATALLTSNTARIPSVGSEPGLPQLPCLNQGIKLGFEGVTSLAVPLFGNQEAAITKIKTAWSQHPEALFPTYAAMILEGRHPRTGPRSPDLLAIQSELYQMGADSPSILLTLPRLARFSAVDVQADLATNRHPAAATARAACLANFQRAILTETTSVPECKAWFNTALPLQEYDLARVFLGRWEQLKPGDASAARNRIRLETASGAYGVALKFIDGMLTTNPTNQWAITQRGKVLKEIRALNDTTRPPAQP